MPVTRAPRAAAILLALGTLAVVLVAAPYKAFELDRFFVPKELVLHLTALLAGSITLARSPRVALLPEDILLAGWLALSALSAALATNPWLATRALGVSFSSVVLFWSARTIALSSRARALQLAIAAAAVCGAATALVQAYGIEHEWFSLNRAPGGTFGNRNFMAHLAAIGAPLVLLRAIEARRTGGFAVGMLAMGVLGAALVLSRSRAAWLAVAASALVLGLALVRLRAMRGARPGGDRTMLLAVGVLIGAGVAIALPNALEWRSDSPYLDSMRSVVNYQEGSGRGRLVQYATSLRMARHDPVLGVGPGNWSVRYPEFAAPGDPSLLGDGRTANPWPSSDWVAFVAERGVPAFTLLVITLALVGVRALRGLWMAADPAAARTAAVLGAVLAAALVVSTFDASLLLPIPAVIVWTALGTLWPTHEVRASRVLPERGRRRLRLAVAGVGAVLVLRSWTQLAAMDRYAQGTMLAQVERAARLDPGSYRIRLRAAELALRRGRCDIARVHAAAALGLFPGAPAPRRVATACAPRPAGARITDATATSSLGARRSASLLDGREADSHARPAAVRRDDGE